MQSFVVSCPRCQTPLNLPTERQTTALHCPQCGARFSAPLPKSIASPPPHAEPLTVEYRATGETVPPVPDIAPAGTVDRVPPAEPATLTFAPAAAIPEKELPLVPGYEVLDELGRGGMGVVYRARQLSLKRFVALKMIRAGDAAGEEELARFRTEAEAVAHLHHPNIVQIYEIGEHHGRSFFSLEFVSGGSLAARLKTERLPNAEAARLVETLARAVQHAHQRGVIHRDLKPANILLMEDGTPKVTDFGLAKRLQEQDVAQTRSGAIMGTPSYMAPEQAMGQSREIGPAVDVYALGAVLYELLTGRPPFRGETVMATLQQVIHEEPEPPSKYQPKLDRDLETICLKALAKPAAQRYVSALALAQDLERYQAGEPILARREGVLRRLTRKVRRNLTATVAVVVLLLMGTAVAIAVFSASATRQVSKLRGQVETGLDGGDWSVENREHLESDLAELERLDAAQAAILRQRLHERFAQKIEDALRAARLAADDIRQIETDLAWLDSRDTPKAALLRKSLRDRLAQWQEVFDVREPFDRLAEVFAPQLVAVKDRHLTAIAPFNIANAIVPTRIASRGATRLEADFDPSWQESSAVGLALHHQPAPEGGTEQGYVFLLSSNLAEKSAKVAEGVPRMPVTQARPLSFATVRGRGLPFEMRLLRNGVLLNKKAIHLPDGPLHLLAHRLGDRLEFQAGHGDSLVFYDVVPLTGAGAPVFGVHWPASVGLTRLRATAQTLPSAASPLEQADDLFEKGRYGDALTLYQGQFATANPTIQQEARYRAGACLVRLNRLDEAAQLFAALTSAEGERWPLLAACQMWMIHLRQKKFDDLDTLLTTLSARFGSEQLSAYVPAQIRQDTIRETLDTGPTNFIMNHPVVLRRVEQGLAIARFFKERSQVFWGGYRLGQMYCVAGQEDKALPLFRECVRTDEADLDAGSKVTYQTVWPLHWYTWLLCRRGAAEEALRQVDRCLLDGAGRPRWTPRAGGRTEETVDPMLLSYLALYLSRARVQAALGKWDQAEADLDEMIRRLPRSTSYQFYASGRLMKGFLCERRDDKEAAKRAWKQGTYSSYFAQLPKEIRSRAIPLGAGNQREALLHHMILASLGDEFPDADAANILQILVKMLEKNAIALQAVRAATIHPSMLREMWRSPRGHELARRLAFHELSPQESVRFPLYLIAVQKFKQDVLTGQASAEVEEQLWQSISEVAESIFTGRLSKAQAIQISLAYKGATNFLGWQGVAPGLEPRLRGKLAYLLGLRYTRLKRLRDAQMFFRTAVKDAAAADSALRKLAEAELKRQAVK